MSRPPFGTDRTTVTFSASPAPRAWAALWLAIAGAILAGAWGLALSEKARAARVDLAEMIIARRMGLDAPLR